MALRCLPLLAALKHTFGCTIIDAHFAYPEGYAAVLLGRWLFAGSRVFLLDEPTRGVDVAARAEIYRAVNRLAEGGAAVVMVSSDLPELLGMADRILVMRRGRLVAELDAKRTTQEEVLTYAALEEEVEMMNAECGMMN